MTGQPSSTTPALSLGRYGYLLLALYGLLLFGYSMIGGRPLTMHEARLPQSTREMLASDQLHDWIVPKSGGRPWIERPPLPHWISAAIVTPLGGADAVWKVRLPSTVMGIICTLLLAGMAARMFGPRCGLLAGFIQATTFEFFRYSWLAEDDIFLCAMIYAALAVFVWLEFPDGTAARVGESLNPLKLRPWPVLGLFVLLGLTNLTKGLVFGTVMACVPIAGYLLWNHNFRHILRYIWLWGWLAFALCALWWPLLAEHLSPGAAEVWRYDLIGRLKEGYLGEPWYYYLKTLPEILAPWPLFALLGLGLTAIPAIKNRYSPLRFVWGWAVLTVVVFSLSDSKHHHYLLHITGAWAILAAFGLQWFWEKLKVWPSFLRNPLLWVGITGAALVPLWLLRQKLHAPEGWLLALTVFLLCLSFVLGFGIRAGKGALSMGALLLGLAGFSSFFFSTVVPHTDQTMQDTEFFAEIPGLVPEDAPLLINADHRGGMDFFRISFYLPARAVMLHNETYLQQEIYRGRVVYIVDRATSVERLSFYGETELVGQSKYSRRENEHAGKITLFRVRVRENIAVYPPEPVSPMQAMARDPAGGPYLGGKALPHQQPPQEE